MPFLNPMASSENTQTHIQRSAYEGHNGEKELASRVTVLWGKLRPGNCFSPLILPIWPRQQVFCSYADMQKLPPLFLHESAEEPDCASHTQHHQDITTLGGRSAKRQCMTPSKPKHVPPETAQKKLQVRVIWGSVPLSATLQIISCSGQRHLSEVQFSAKSLQGGTIAIKTLHTRGHSQNVKEGNQ